MATPPVKKENGYCTNGTVDEQIKHVKELLAQQTVHLKEMMQQHDQLTALAIEKDMAATYAKQKATDSALQGLRNSFDENIKSVTERWIETQKNVDEKITTLSTTMADKLTTMNTTIEEKRESSLKAVGERVTANIKSEGDKFTAVDKQMQLLIDNNAQISNTALEDLNKWRHQQTARQQIVDRMMAFLLAIVIALAAAFFKTLF